MKSGFSPSPENSWIRWEKYRFSLQLYTRCMVSSMHFFNFLGKAHPCSASTDFYPRSISGCVFDLGFALNSRALAPSIGSGFALNSPPPTCLLTPPQHKGTRSNTVPQPQLLVSPNTRPKISFQEYVVGWKYTIEKLLTAGWENFLKIH